MRITKPILLLSVWAAACGEGEAPVSPDRADGGVITNSPDGGTQTSSVPLSIREARRLYPRVFELQTGIIQKTCSPNPGVCHNNNNYPNLRTPGTFLQVFGAPCNVEIPDPTLGWDRCERRGDRFKTEGFEAEIAWRERLGPGRWRVGLRTSPSVSGEQGLRLETAGGEVVLQPIPEWNVTATLVARQPTVEVNFAPPDVYVLGLLDTAMKALVEGDPNRNGVFGSESGSPGELVTAGSLERSYLWGRITGTVPGSRMPVANAPLTNAAYAAIACYIEQAEKVGTNAEAPIDYANCQYARAPLDPAVP